MPNFSELASGLGQKWQELDPILKTTLLATGAGGLAGGALSSMSPKPASPEGRKARRKRIISNAGLAAILAGGATAGIGYGARQLGEAMPKGSKPPGQAAHDAITGLGGRLGLFSAGAAAAGARGSGRAKGDINHLAKLLKHEGSGASALSAFEREPFHLKADTADQASRNLVQAANMEKMTEGGLVNKKDIVRKLVRGGINIDPNLLEDGSKLKALLQTKGIGRPAGHILSFLRRRGPGKMLAGGSAWALAPEIIGGGYKALTGMTGGSGEGEL